MFKQLDVLETVDSTNDYLKRWIEQRRPRAAMARAQSAGRGRHGSSWESTPHEGLYVSYLFFPDWPQTQAPVLNMIAALAVKHAVGRIDPKLGKRVGFKEPNDVLLGGKKLAGILVELGSLGNLVRWAVVGIGVNLSQRRFHLVNPKVEPTSVLLAGGKPPAPMAFYDVLTPELVRLCESVDRGRLAEIKLEFETLVLERNLP